MSKLTIVYSNFPEIEQKCFQFLFSNVFDVLNKNKTKYMNIVFIPSSVLGPVFRIRVIQIPPL